VVLYKVFCGAVWAYYLVLTAELLCVYSLILPEGWPGRINLGSWLNTKVMMMMMCN